VALPSRSGTGAQPVQQWEGWGLLPFKLRITVHGEVSRMPEIPETAELEALIRALISKADDCLRRQLDDVRRNAASEQSHDQDALADAS
jgi:hypothetical protein